MTTRSLYLDTSVFGGYYDEKFLADTRALWRLRDAGWFRFVSSVTVDQEIAKAPERVRELIKSFSPTDVLPMTAEAAKLAGHYLAAKVVPMRYADDARHVAACTVAQLDFLVSWNFKHLVNAGRETGFNTVNFLHGHRAVRIVTPSFLIHDHEKKGI